MEYHDQFVAFDIAAQVKGRVGLSFVGVLDDIGGGLVRGQLHRIHSFFAETGLAGGLPYEVADLFQLLKLGPEFSSGHWQSKAASSASGAASSPSPDSDPGRV